LDRIESPTSTTTRLVTLVGFKTIGNRNLRSSSITFFTVPISLLGVGRIKASDLNRKASMRQFYEASMSWDHNDLHRQQQENEKGEKVLKMERTRN
jgi:hypothetical protein